MFSIPGENDWGHAETDEIKEKKSSKKDKARTLVKSFSAHLLSSVSRKTDAVFNSPGQTRGLLEHTDDDDRPENGTPRKKKKKKKSKEEKEKNSSSSLSSLKDSVSSMTDSVGSSAGSILRKGLKFANYEEFCTFVDAKRHKNKRKSSEGDKDEEEEEVRAPSKKKLKVTESVAAETQSKEPPKSSSFDIGKLKAILGGNKQKQQQEEAEADASVSSSKAKSKLKSSRFRYLNELLYTQPGSKSFKMFREDTDAFKTYHEGYMEQARKWPNDPLQVIISALMKTCDKKTVVADFGCGEARLAQALPDVTVHSFDFVALNDLVTPCDMSKTPLPDEAVDVAVFCLSLMGTNLRDFLKEANRVLKIGGVLKIAEVESRFQESVESFIEQVQKFGFSLKWKEVSKGFFVYMDFRKVATTKKKAPEVALKPCIYKKR